MKTRLIILIALIATYTAYAEKPFGTTNHTALSSGLSVNHYPNFSNGFVQQKNTYTFDQLHTTLDMAKKANGLEKTGKIMTFAGLPLIVIGAILMSNADSYSYTNVNGVEEGDLGGAVGVLSLVAGVGVSGTGIVLWTIGKNK